MRTSCAQACITNVSFPTALGGLRGMMRKNAAVRAEWELDFDVLASYEPATGYEWTTGPWLRDGDFIFFYHAKGAAGRIAELRKAGGTHGKLARTLRRAAEFSEAHAGTIFAYGQMSADPKRTGQYAAGNHFATQACAPCEYVRMLREPLGEDVWAPFLQVKRRGAVTPLMARQARRLRDCVLRTVAGDADLRKARFGDPAFPRVSKRTWRRVAGNGSLFGYEHQVREYVADFVLAEVGDKGSYVLEECRCFRGGRYMGQVDAFVMVSGDWVPVEVKLDTGSTPPELMRAQLARYVGVERCTPVLGVCRGQEFVVGGGSAGLVIDRHGIYLTWKGRFLECVPGRPRWPISELDASQLDNIRVVLGALRTCSGSARNRMHSHG